MPSSDSSERPDRILRLVFSMLWVRSLISPQLYHFRWPIVLSSGMISSFGLAAFSRMWFSCRKFLKGAEKQGSPTDPTGPGLCLRSDIVGIVFHCVWAAPLRVDCSCLSCHLSCWEGQKAAGRLSARCLMVMKSRGHSRLLFSF